MFLKHWRQWARYTALANPMHAALISTLHCLRGRAGEAIAFRGLRRISRLHGPAVVGQAAVFSAYVDECRSRLHTGGLRSVLCTPHVGGWQAAVRVLPHGCWPHCLSRG